MNIQLRAVLTPCIGVCALDGDGICMGCHRTTDEIARWGQMDDGERIERIGMRVRMRMHPGGEKQAPYPVFVPEASR